jgi:outer membrane lipoprotein SlyB
MTILDGKKKFIVIVAASALTVGAVAATIVTEVVSRSSTASPASLAVPPETPQVSEAPTAAAPAPVYKRVATKAHAPVTSVASVEATQPPPSAASCVNCGVVQSIQSFTEKGPASGGGAVAGGLIGGILGHQVGQGRGKELATVAGAVGGAFAGNAVEKNANKVTGYHVAVRMNDGSQQLFTLNAPPSLAVGDRVVITNGAPVRE